MIWGVDLGIRSYYAVGIWGSLAAENEVIARAYERAKAKTRYEELRSVVLDLAEYITADDYVFVEEPPLAGKLNIRTFGQLSMISGAILSATPAQGYMVPVDTWKKATVGRGGADKATVAQWLADTHPQIFQRCVGNQNLVDAACIAIYGNKIISASGRAAEPDERALGHKVRALGLDLEPGLPE